MDTAVGTTWKGEGLPVDDLHQFMALLDELGELRRVKVTTDPHLEIATVTERVRRLTDGGPALLFQHVAGSSFSLAVNLFGSARRMALALGLGDLSDLRAVGERLCDDPGSLDSFTPHLLVQPPCQQVSEKPDLGSIPFIRCWEKDGGSTVDGFLTLPLVISRDPDTGVWNCGMYRASRQGANRLGLAWRPGSGAARHAEAYERRGEPMPLAVVLGGPPALIYAATVPFPEEVDELAFAGLLSGEPLPVARTDVGGLLVPATAEMVLEGYVHPGDRGDEGHFGNHTGRYVTTGPVPVMTVTRITRRTAPVIPATVVGPPPTENRWFARATERLMLPFLQREEPAVTDCAYIPGGEYHGAAVVALRRGAGAAIPRITAGLRRTSWLGGSRLLLFVHEDEDCHDPASLFWRVLNRQAWPAVMEELPPLPSGERGCLVIDGTRSDSEREKEVGRPEALADMVSRRWAEYGLDGQDES
jgi:4-hydroxy-3-polyprenylbenzoate decarboxylase